MAGCASTVEESHYFAAFREDPVKGREAVQFYRVNVDGNTQFANARYLTGYFDERAVSLFFNEMKSPANSQLFEESRTLPGSPDTKLTPLNPANGEGAFVLIMSTNADSIANAIGSFAESQVVADSLTRLVNRSRFQAKATSDAQLSVQKAEAAALVSRLDSSATAAKQAATGAAAAVSYRRALTALAQALGYSGPEFGSFDEARSWFNLEGSRRSDAP